MGHPGVHASMPNTLCSIATWLNHLPTKKICQNSLFTYQIVWFCLSPPKAFKLWLTFPLLSHPNLLSLQLLCLFALLSLYLAPVVTFSLSLWLHCHCNLKIVSLVEGHFFFWLLLFNVRIGHSHFLVYVVWLLYQTYWQYRQFWEFSPPLTFVEM